MDSKTLQLIKNLSISYELALAIGTSLDLEEMLEHLLNTIVRKVNALRGIVWIYNGSRLDFLTGAGFHAKTGCCCSIDDGAAVSLKKIILSGQTTVITFKDHDFRKFCLPHTKNERQIMLVPVGGKALLQLSFTCENSAGPELAKILTGIAPKLSNAITSCLNHARMLSMERAQREHTELRYYDLVNNLDAGIYVSTPEGLLLDANPAFLKMFGLSGHERIGEITWYSCFSNTGDRDKFKNTIDKGGHVKNKEYLFKRRDGELFWGQVTAVLRHNRREKHIMGIVSDITERKMAEKQLQYLATHDSLTNIPNRHYLLQSLKRVVAQGKRGKRSALLLMDLDNFKLVNDTMGHTAGDELLVKLTGILKGNLREGDFIARLGGDEFAVLLEDVTPEDAEVVAEKLRRAVDDQEALLCVQRQCFNISISIGIIMIDGKTDFQRLLSMADAALYRAKKTGRNKVVCAEAVL